MRFSTVEVPKQDDGALRMSSLVLVKRGEKVPEKERRAGQSAARQGRRSSTRTSAIRSARPSKELGFYFAVYPAPGGRRPKRRIELLQNGKLVAQVPMPLAAADASGRVQQVGRLPLEQLAPGTYELRAIVKQGTTQVVAIGDACASSTERA